MGAERGDGGDSMPPYGPNAAEIASRELGLGVCATRVRIIGVIAKRRTRDSILRGGSNLGRPVKPSDDGDVA